MNKSNYEIKEEELLKFLKFSYFGDLNISIKVASNRAYRDMCRTIRFGNFLKDDRLELKKEVNSFLDTEIKSLTLNFQGDFDTWHCEVCKNMKNLYEENGIKLNYGQAQKWINMTIKYLYLFGGYTFDSVFEELHIPVDNYILDIANKNVGIDKPKTPWSKWDEEQYRNYQNEIKSKIKIAPLLWEFKNWLEVAKGNNNN